jgi:prolyl-tRNA synthetase
MRTRLFLRTAEFLWQEGHTAHATSEEAVEETMKMLGVYAEFAESWMAMPVIQGEKTAGERFPGAVQTYCIEAMMQDRKALQAGTSHFLGQNFAKASGIKFQDDKGGIEHAWTTSWGVSTRLIGGMIMTHADDDGMVCPPKLAPEQVIIIPVIQKPEDRDRVMTFCKALEEDLEAQTFAGTPVRVHIDGRDMRGGEKKWHWVKKGAPIRLEVGPRDIEKDSVAMARRDKPSSEKNVFIPRAEIIATIGTRLQEIHDALFARALAHRAEHTKVIDTKDEFYAYFAAPKTKKENDPTPIHAGFALTHFNGDPALEAQIKNDLAVTVRCIPLDENAKVVQQRLLAASRGLQGAKHDSLLPLSDEPGTCPFTGQPSAKRVVWAKSY